MARINSNIPALIARSTLTRTNKELESSIQRLSTGLRINRGADDPAGLIVSERLRADVRGVEQGVRNSDRASSVIATTEAALAEVSDLLNSIRALIVEAASTGGNSSQEREANQLQIDSAIDSITRISNTASFGGLKLLNGSLDYNLSGVSASAIAKAQVFGASFISSGELQVDVEVLASAQVGALFVRGDLPTPGAVHPGSGEPLNGTVLSTTTLRIEGPRGVSEVTVVSGASLADLAKAVNNLRSLTGVEASLLNPSDAASGLVFRSIDFGAESFVSVKRIGGPDQANSAFRTYKLPDDGAVPAYPPFPWSALTLTTADRDSGRDVSALVNGNLATGDGLTLSVYSPSLSVKLILDQQFATRPSSPGNDRTNTFYITGGGALFQLGPQVNANQQTNVGLQSIAASSLGGTLVDGSLQFLSSLKSGQANSIRENVQRGDFTGASDILDAAIDEVAILRGRLGAFERNVLQTNVRSLQSAFENLSASESQIRDADFAVETSRLTRAQILTSTGTTVLTLANQQAQSVLQLLG